MDILVIPPDIKYTEIPDEFLEYVKRVSQLESVTVDSNRIIVKGDPAKVKSAVDLFPVHEVLLRRMIKNTVTKMCSISKNCMALISLTEMKNLVSPEVELSIVNAQVRITAPFSIATQTVKFIDSYLNGLKLLAPSTSSSHVRKNDKGQFTRLNHQSGRQNSQKRYRYPCPFCQKPTKSDYLSRHCREYCDEGKKISPQKLSGILKEHYKKFRQDRSGGLKRRIAEVQSSSSSASDSESTVSIISVSSTIASALSVANSTTTASTVLDSSTADLVAESPTAVSTDKALDSSAIVSSVPALSTFPAFYIKEYSEFNNTAFSGKSHFQRGTKEAKVERFSKICRHLRSPKQLFDHEGMATALGAVESFDVEASSTYSYITAIQDYLAFYKARLASDHEMNAITKAEDEWDNARKVWQARLVSDRAKKKKTKSDQMIRGKLPTLVDVGIFIFFRRIVH